MTHGQQAKVKEDVEAARLSAMEELPIPSVTPFLSVGILMGQRPRIIIGRLPGHLNKAAAHKVLAHQLSADATC